MVPQHGPLPRAKGSEVRALGLYGVYKGSPFLLLGSQEATWCLNGKV